MRISPFTDYNGAIDPDPEPAYRYLVEELNERGIGWLELADTSFWYGKFERSRMLELVSPVFDGKLIANGGIDPAQANELICQRRGGRRVVRPPVDGESRPARAHPPRRALRKGDHQALLRRRADGYNDYPTLEQEFARKRVRP